MSPAAVKHSFFPMAVKESVGVGSHGFEPAREEATSTLYFLCITSQHKISSTICNQDSTPFWTISQRLLVRMHPLLWTTWETSRLSLWYTMSGDLSVISPCFFNEQSPKTLLHLFFFIVGLVPQLIKPLKDLSLEWKAAVQTAAKTQIDLKSGICHSPSQALFFIHYCSSCCFYSLWIPVNKCTLLCVCLSHIYDAPGFLQEYFFFSIIHPGLATEVQQHLSCPLRSLGTRTHGWGNIMQSCRTQYSQGVSEVLLLINHCSWSLCQCAHPFLCLHENQIPLQHPHPSVSVHEIFIV